VHTLPKPGEYLCSVATTNDVHFGEVECGRLGETPPGRSSLCRGSSLSVMMSSSGVEEIAPGTLPPSW